VLGLKRRCLPQVLTGPICSSSQQLSAIHRTGQKFGLMDVIQRKIILGILIRFPQKFRS
jgi:hypothetical protein